METASSSTALKEAESEFTAPDSRASKTHNPARKRKLKQQQPLSPSKPRELPEDETPEGYIAFGVAYKHDLTYPYSLSANEAAEAFPNVALHQQPKTLTMFPHTLSNIVDEGDKAVNVILRDCDVCSFMLHYTNTSKLI